MAAGIGNGLAEYRALYIEKNTHLDSVLNRVEPYDFYREIFPKGSFEREGRYEDKKPNGIAVSLPDSGGHLNGVADEIQGGGRVKRYTVTDDLKKIDELKELDFVIMAPVSYFGRSRSGKMARFLYALAFDLDGVGMPQLRDVIHQMNRGVLPKATFLVNSGTGLHLYYVLTEPVPMYPQNQHYLKELKYSLTRQIWNRFTSTIEQPQMQGLMQGFRVVGSKSKLGREYPVVAYRFGGRVELDSFLEFVPDGVGERQKLQGILKKSSLPLEEAKKKYPDWYQRRIVNGERRCRWTIKRDLYDWWLGRIRREIKVGHRYHGIMTLAIYAKKCCIDEAELRRDAYELLKPFDDMSTESLNRFTEDDIEAALTMFNEDYVTFPRDDISRLTGMSMPTNRRNGRKQATHIKMMNLIRDEVNGNKEWWNKEGRPKGSGTMQAKVQQWQMEHPAGRKIDCHRDTGISRSAIDKWWTYLQKDIDIVKKSGIDKVI